MTRPAPPLTTILEQARALDAGARLDYVRRACGSDETLLSRVLSALDEREHASGFWDEMAEDNARPTHVRPGSLEGQQLGRYRILSKLGSGGMGDVYLAERADDEYQQRVAIKLVRSGVFSPQVQGRLRMERQILASLQHPNIARLLDGGRAPDGAPYLVMEYIDGEPIDVYCNRRRASLAERLRLVRTVCAAVQYAHQNLIVHRDLKPNNILITADGTPKLLDFGIAKLLDTRFTAQTLAVTHFEYRVMTPAHASPEQVRGDAVTTASDIYVLGVLLFELLCGQRPYQLEGANLIELERLICEQQAPTPSQLLTQTLADAPELAADIAACRGVAPQRLIRELQGDLDNIVSMAMRKDPQRRYRSAEQLGADIDRTLAGLPVSATPDHWAYRARKFVARHRWGVGAAASVATMLIAFAVVTYLQAQRIAAERDAAHVERTRAEQVSSFLVELFELADPSRTRGAQVTARELLDIGARRVNVGLAQQPETRAMLLGTIGRVYGGLGLYPDSVRLLEEALALKRRVHGEQHAEVARAAGELAQALCAQGQLDACERELRTALQIQLELSAEDDIQRAPLIALEGDLAHLRGMHTEAADRYEQALSLYQRHGRARSPEAASVLSELASVLFAQDKTRAATLYRTALDINRDTLGGDHPHIAMDLHNLAVVLQAQGDLQAAEPLYAQSAELLQRLFGDAHPHTLDAMANYGRFLHQRGDLAHAERVLNTVVENDRRARGPDHPFIGHDLVTRGLLRLDMKRDVEAQADFTAALSIYARALPADHPYVASALIGLGRAQLEQGRLADVEATLARAAPHADRVFSTSSPQRAALQSIQGRVQLARGNPRLAAPLLEASYPVLLQAHGEHAVLTQQTRAALAQLGRVQPANQSAPRNIR